MFILTHLIFQKSLQIPFGEKIIEAILSQPVGDDIEPSDTIGGVILTHGAGGDMNLPQLAQIANHLAEKGRLMCARFTCRALNLKYRIKVYKAVVVCLSIIVFILLVVLK